MRRSSPIVQKTPLGSRRFYYLFFLDVLRSVLGVSFLFLLALQLCCVGVLVVEMRIRVTHGIAGCIGISSFFLAL